jgi:hypothetical protein
LVKNVSRTMIGRSDWFEVAGLLPTLARYTAL